MPVVNLYKSKYDIYIGRAGKGKSGYFGNSIIPNQVCPVCDNIHQKSETLPCFELAARDRIKKDPEYRQRVAELDGMILGCFCAPNPCHGDILLKLAAELQKEVQP